MVPVELPTTKQLNVYLAMRPVDALLASSQQLVQPMQLGKWAYIPLKCSPDVAIEGSLRNWTVGTPQMVTKHTTWVVLHVTFSPIQCLHLFKERILTNPFIGNTPGYRYYGHLDLNIYDHSWQLVSVPPTGLDVWADLYLMENYTKEWGQCGACDKIGDVWDTTGGGISESTCAMCSWIAVLQSAIKRQTDKCGKPKQLRNN